jgi:ankyrin repeat protein
MMQAWASASILVRRECLKSKLGYRLLGEANRRLVEDDDVEGLGNIFARDGEEKKGVMLVFACVLGASRCAQYLVKQGAMQDVDVAVCGESLVKLSPITIAALLGHWGVVEALMEGGAETHAFDSAGFSVLLIAANQYPEGNLELLLRLEDIRRHINTANLQGATPLMVASASAVPLLVEAGADVDMLTGEPGAPSHKCEATAFFHACYSGSIEKVKALVTYGANEQHACASGKNSLMLAAEKGHAHIVQYLVSRRVINIDAETISGHRALDLACRKGHLEVVKVMVAAGARVNLQTSDKVMPLGEAVIGGHLHVVKYLVEEAGADENRGTADGMTPLMWAADKNQADIMAYLLGRPGIDIMAKTAKGDTALVLASQGNLEVVKLLVAAGARVDPQSSNEVGALASASVTGHLHVVKYLVEEAGADVGRAGREGATPLIFAADKGQAEIVAYLLSRPGIDIEAETDMGRRAIDLASHHGHLEVVKLLVAAGARVHSQASKEDPFMEAVLKGHLHVIEYLVKEAGADINAAMFRMDGCSQRVTACDFSVREEWWDVVECLVDLGADLSLCIADLGIEAIRCGDESLVARLIDAGMNLTCREQTGMTLLHLAATFSLSIAKVLVEVGSADVEARDGGGRTPLMCASSTGHLDIVKWLVEAGADIYAKNKRGRTALDLARSGRHASIVEYLQGVISQRESEVSVLELIEVFDK